MVSTTGKWWIWVSHDLADIFGLNIVAYIFLAAARIGSYPNSFWIESKKWNLFSNIDIRVQVTKECV